VTERSLHKRKRNGLPYFSSALKREKGLLFTWWTTGGGGRSAEKKKGSTFFNPFTSGTKKGNSVSIFTLKEVGEESAAKKSKGEKKENQSQNKKKKEKRSLSKKKKNTPATLLCW